MLRIVPVANKLDVVIPLTFKLPLDTFVETKLVVVMFVVSTLFAVIPLTLTLPVDKFVIIPLVTLRVALL